MVFGVKESNKPTTNNVQISPDHLGQDHLTVWVKIGRYNISRTTHDRKTFLVSRVWFLRSRNPTNLLPMTYDHHLTIWVKINGPFGSRYVDSKSPVLHMIG